ncbi:hypothetical protein [Streptomyces sp. MMBL 11-1]|uniref:hypothetical protein n=1 Tax=Streptomyces sp. MMBL 11-1 TaxID=3026420 RepID=UPI00236164BA|nr:hypothetical protein [Streptomyces sp. MMBL 11-1]
MTETTPGSIDAWNKVPTPDAPGLTGVVSRPDKSLWLFRGTFIADLADPTPHWQHLNVRWPELRFTAGRHPYRAPFVAEGRLWMFRGDRYLKLDLTTGQVVTPADADPAKEINLDKTFVHGITAATAISDTEVYLFNGATYYLYNFEHGAATTSSRTLDLAPFRKVLPEGFSPRIDAVGATSGPSDPPSLLVTSFSSSCKATAHEKDAQLQLGDASKESQYNWSFGPVPTFCIPLYKVIGYGSFARIEMRPVDLSGSTVDTKEPAHVRSENRLDTVAFGQNSSTGFFLIQDHRIYPKKELFSSRASMALDLKKSVSLKVEKMNYTRACLIAGETRLLITSRDDIVGGVGGFIAVPRVADLHKLGPLDDKDTYPHIEPGGDTPFVAVPCVGDDFYVVTREWKTEAAMMHWFNAPKDGAVELKGHKVWPWLRALGISFDGTTIYYVSGDGKCLYQSQAKKWGYPVELLKYPEDTLWYADPVATPDGRAVAVGRRSAKVEIVYTESKEHKTVTLPDSGSAENCRIQSLFADPNGNLLFVFQAYDNEPPEVFVIDIDTAALVDVGKLDLKSKGFEGRSSVVAVPYWNDAG